MMKTPTPTLCVAPGSPRWQRGVCPRSQGGTQRVTSESLLQLCHHRESVPAAERGDLKESPPSHSTWPGLGTCTRP